MIAEFQGFPVKRNKQRSEFIVLAVVLEGGLPYHGADRNGQTEFLIEFPDRGIGSMFAWFKLATWKLPLATHGSTSRPSGDKNAGSADGYAGYRAHL